MHSLNVISRLDGHARGFCLVLLAAFCYGLQPLFAQYAYAGGADPVGLLLARFTLAAVILGIALLSALFGVWHLLPSSGVVGNVGVNETVGDDRWLIAVLAILATTVAGIVLCWWRWMGRGLLTSAMVHIATNSVGFAIAWSLLH